ncbi:diacylglycerol/lipid kinase family protein [Legionella gresilensis]|uniref:diacylglycerol/lipid kinase family protein n=1 Tax=Legionella gresilensis TaxID=91823 RepID=UPI001041944D|nr:diacylglycerol kinase family protein [Legionella gresilensis]
MVDIAVIVNSKAKNANQLTPYLEGLTKQNVAYQLYKTHPANLEETIKQCQLNHPILLVGGGDGTIRSAAQWCANTKTILGVLPLGTLNHFAKELDLPSTVDELIDAIQKHSTSLIDCAEVNGNVFINNSSIGFYPKLAEKRDYYTKFYNKWISYIPSFIKALFYHRSYSLLIKCNDFNILLKSSFFMISNNLYSYEFPLSYVRDSFNDAKLGIYYFKHGKLRLFEILRVLFTKKHNFEIKQTQYPVEVTVHYKEKINISLDGDTLTVTTPLTYRSLPKSLILLTKNYENSSYL